MLTSPESEGGSLRVLLGRNPSTRILWGLERIQEILAALDDPHLSFESVLIGGTNGKGSTAVMAEAVARADGTRTGLYTSPHLVHPAERVRVDGRPVEVATLDACAADVLPIATRVGATFFESLTAAAFLAFARSDVELAIVEVGLGGRLDATNVLDPLACAITSIGLDHADYLGDTLESIAREKAGILKAGAPVVVGPLPGDPRRIVEERALEVGAPLDAYGKEFGAEGVRTALDGTRFTYRADSNLDGERFWTPLPGVHQATNAALALRVIEAAGRTLQSEPSRKALAGIRWPGRFQVIRSGDGTMVLDVAHNPEGARALASTIERVGPPAPIVALVGILGDKPWREMLEPVLRHAAGAVFTVPRSAPASRRWDPVRAREEIGMERVEVVAEFTAALRRARELADGGTVLVTGSSHTVGDALAALADESGWRDVDGLEEPAENPAIREEENDAVQP